MIDQLIIDFPHHWSQSPLIPMTPTLNHEVGPSGLASPTLSLPGEAVSYCTSHYWPIQCDQSSPGKQRHSYQSGHLRSDCPEVGDKGQIKFPNTHRQGGK